MHTIHQNKLQQDSRRNKSKINTKTKINNAKATENYVKQYNKSAHEPHIYSLGDPVLVQSFAVKNNLTKNFLPKYRGSFKIIQKLDHNNFIYGDEFGQTAKINYDQIKPFYLRNNQKLKLAKFKLLGRPRKIISGQVVPASAKSIKKKSSSKSEKNEKNSLVSRYSCTKRITRSSAKLL